MKQRHQSRRRFLIKKHLQLYYALTSLVLLLSAVLCTWFFMHLTLTTLVMEQGILYENAALYLVKANRIVWVCMMGSGIAVFLMTLFFSRHVAGPLYRMEQAMSDLVENGSADHVAFRRHDLLHETGALLNQVISAWKKK